MSSSILQSESPRNPRLTWEGCSVLLDINDGDRLVFARLSPASTLKIGNKSFSLKPLIGCPFGSLFQIENGGNGPHLARVMPSREEGINCQEMEEMKEEQVIKDELRDNRAIVDNNKAQSLSSEDIDAMRRVQLVMKLWKLSLPTVQHLKRKQFSLRRNIDSGNKRSMRLGYF